METNTEHERSITYFVNDEAQSTTSDKLSVRAILEGAGFKPAVDYSLTRDEGNYTYGSLDEEVPLHNDERFTALFKGPTPTSERP